MLNEQMYEFGSKSSVIRELFAYGLERKKIVGEDKVYDFSIGNPSIPAPVEVKQAILALLEEPAERLHGYSPASGDPEVRAALADSVNRKFGVHYTADNFYMTVGAAASLSISTKALTNPGDEFITFAPYFPEYAVWVETAGARLLVTPADKEKFQIDFEAFERLIGPKTRGVITNSPNNPSGVVYSEDTIRRLAQILTEKQKEYGNPIYLITDEPYREIVYDGVEVPFVPKYYKNTLVCYSYSKSLSLPGERIGYVAVNPACTDAELISAMCSQISRGTGHNCPPSIIQLAVAEVLDLTSDLSVYETNMNILYKELTDLGFTCEKPGGTFYMFPKALEEDAVAFSEKAKKYDLILVPSDSFGVQGYFRIAYCIGTEKVERSLDAFRRFVKNEY